MPILLWGTHYRSCDGRFASTITGVGVGLWLTSIFPKPFDVVIGNPPLWQNAFDWPTAQYFASSLYDTLTPIACLFTWASSC